jgi:mono/diheme cytochrome c family protein
MIIRAVRLTRLSLWFFSIIVGVLSLSACSFSLAEDILPPPGSEQRLAPTEQADMLGGPLYPIVAPDPDNGAATYAEKCAPCHGVTGLGDGPRATQLPVPVPAIGTAEVARPSTPARWYEIVTQGNMERFMPPFESLPHRQKWDVIAYVYSLSQSPEMIAQE